MKKTYSILILLIVLFSACDVLNQEPESLILTEQAIVDRQSAISAVNGLYSTLQNGNSYGGRQIMASEMLAGNGVATAFQAFWQELATGKVPSANFYIEENWAAHYSTINAANAILESVPEIGELSDSEKEEMTGVAYLMRALAHFDLLRQFGEFFDMNSSYGIPLKLKSTREDDLSELPRSSVAATYTQIEADLNQAINTLGGGSSFLATRSAAQALMARVLLYEKKFDKAAAMASEVINGGSYELSEDYNDVYNSEGSPESIFELNFIQLTDGNSFASEMYVSPPEVSVSQSLIDFFNTRGEDERNALFEQTSNGLNRCVKYGTSAQEDGGNTIVIRLSEMYLIRAEALGLAGDPNDALDDINMIRDRAGLDDITNISSDGELLDILLDERRAEFAFEGHYWFDIVRYDKLTDIRGIESFRKVLPIPFREMNITDGTLEQNPGYN